MELAIKAQEQAEKNEKISSSNNWNQYRAKHFEDFQKVSERFNVHHYVV